MTRWENFLTKMKVEETMILTKAKAALKDFADKHLTEDQSELAKTRTDEVSRLTAENTALREGVRCILQSAGLPDQAQGLRDVITKANELLAQPA